MVYDDVVDVDIWYINGVIEMVLFNGEFLFIVNCG